MEEKGEVQNDLWREVNKGRPTGGRKSMRQLMEREGMLKCEDSREGANRLLGERGGKRGV